MSDSAVSDTDRPSLTDEQPAPVPNASRPIWDLVVEDMRARDRVGRERYGMPLQSDNGRDPLVDAYQEALDLAVYLRQAIEERTHVPQPGDMFRCKGPERVGGSVGAWRLREVRRPDGANAGAGPIYVFDNPDAPGDEKALFVWTHGRPLCEEMLFVPPALPHRQGVGGELARLRQRESELLAANTREMERRRAVDRQLMVREFMLVFGQPCSAWPGVIPQSAEYGPVGDGLLRFRMRLIAEEFVELCTAVFAEPHPHNYAAWEFWKLLMGGGLDAIVSKAPIALRLPEAIDATVDLDYVVEGFRATFGFDSNALFRVVHEANMAKAGPDGRPRRREADGKVLKWEGWVAPDIAGELRRQGWRG